MMREGFVFWDLYSGFWKRKQCGLASPNCSNWGVKENKGKRDWWGCFAVLSNCQLKHLSW